MMLNYLISSLSVLLMVNECSSWIRFRMPPSRRNYVEQTPRGKLQNCGGNMDDCGICGEGSEEVQTYTIPPEKYTVVDPSQRLLGVEVGFRSDLHGYLEFRICAISDNYTTDAITCKKTLPLLIGQESKWSPARGQNFADSRFRLPPDLVCERCVLQVKYTSGNDSTMKAFRFYDCALLNITKLNEKLPADHLAELRIPSTSSDLQNHSSTSSYRENQSLNEQITKMISERILNKANNGVNIAGSHVSISSSDDHKDSKTRGVLRTIDSKPSEGQSLHSLMFPPDHSLHDRHNSNVDATTSGELDNSIDILQAIRSSFNFARKKSGLSTGQQGNISTSLEVLRTDSKVRSDRKKSVNSVGNGSASSSYVNTTQIDERFSSMTTNTTQGDIPAANDSRPVDGRILTVSTRIHKVKTLGNPISTTVDQRVSITTIDVADHNNVASEIKNEDSSQQSMANNIGRTIENANSMPGTVFETSTGNSFNITTRNIVNNDSIANIASEDSMAEIFVTNKNTIMHQNSFNASSEQLSRTETIITDFDMTISVNSSSIDKLNITVYKEKDSVHNMSRNENPNNNLTTEIVSNGTNLYDNEIFRGSDNNDSYTYYDDSYYYDYNTSEAINETIGGTASISNQTSHPAEVNKTHFANNSMTDTTRPSLLGEESNIILDKNVDTKNIKNDSDMTLLSNNTNDNTIESGLLGDVVNDTEITIEKDFNKTMDKIGLWYENVGNNTSNLSTFTNDSESDQNGNNIVQKIVKVTNDLIVQLNQPNEDKTVVLSREPVRLSINRWEVLNKSESDTAWNDSITGWADISDNFPNSPRYVPLSNTDISSWKDIRNNTLVSESTTISIQQNTEAGNLTNNFVENKLIDYADQLSFNTKLVLNSQETALSNLDIESNRSVNDSLHINVLLGENNIDLTNVDVSTELITNKINITSLNNDTVFPTRATQTPEVKKTSQTFVPTSHFKSAQDFITRAYEQFRDNTPDPQDMQHITTEIFQAGTDVITRAYDTYVGIPPTTISPTGQFESNFIQLLNLSSDSVSEAIFPALRQDTSSSPNMVVNITSRSHKTNTELISLFSTTVSSVSHNQSKVIPDIQSKVNIPHKQSSGTFGTMKHNETVTDNSLFSSESSNFLKDHGVTVDQLGGIPVSQIDDVINWEMQIQDKNQGTNLMETLNTIEGSSSSSLDVINTHKAYVNSNRTFFKWDKAGYTYFVVPLGIRNSSYSDLSENDSISDASTIVLMDKSNGNTKPVYMERNGQNKDHRSAGTRFVGRIGQTVEDAYANLKFVEKENALTETGNSFGTTTQKIENTASPEVQTRVIWQAMHSITSNTTPNVTISTFEEENRKGNIVNTIVKNIERLTRTESTKNSIDTTIERLTKGNAETTNNSNDINIGKFTHVNEDPTYHAFDTQNIKLLDSMDITVNGDAVLNKISKMKLNSPFANHETGAFETPKQMPAIVANGGPSMNKNKEKSNQDYKSIELLNPTTNNGNSLTSGEYLINTDKPDSQTNVNIGEKNKATNLSETIFWDINRLSKTEKKTRSSKELTNLDTLPITNDKWRIQLFEVNHDFLQNDGKVGDNISRQKTQENDRKRTLLNNENGNKIAKSFEVGPNLLQTTKTSHVLIQDKNTVANNIVTHNNVSRTLQALALELEVFTKKNGKKQHGKIEKEEKEVKDKTSANNSRVSNTENINGNYLVETGATYRPYPNSQDSYTEQRVADVERVGGFHSNINDKDNSLRGSQLHKMMNLQGKVDQKEWMTTPFINTDFQSSSIRDFDKTSRQRLNQVIIAVTGGSEGNSDLISAFTDSFSNSSNVNLTQTNENIGKHTNIKEDINKTAISNIVNVENNPEIPVNASVIQNTVVSDNTNEVTLTTQTLINSTGEMSDRHFVESGIMFLPNTSEQGHDKFIARGIGNLRHVMSVEQTDKKMFPLGVQAEEYHLFHKLPSDNLISIEGKYFVGQMRRNKFGQFEPVPLASDLTLLPTGMQESNLYLGTSDSSYISTDVNPTNKVENWSNLMQSEVTGLQKDSKQNIFSNENKDTLVSQPDQVSNVNSNGSEVEGRQFFYSQTELLKKLGITGEETNDRSVKVSESNKNLIQSKENVGQCAGNELFVCRVSGKNQFIPGMVWWCFQQCRNNRSCPTDLCDCKCRNVTIKPTTASAEQIKQPVITRSKDTESKRRKTVINLTLNGSVEAKIPVSNMADRASTTIANRKITENIQDKGTNTSQRANVKTSQDPTNALQTLVSTTKPYIKDSTTSSK